MSKGLEALGNIKREAGTPYFSSLYDIDDWLEDFKTVEKDLNRLEKLEKENQNLKEENSKLKKVIDFLKLNFDISLDSKLRISDGSECVQSFIVYLPENATIDEMFEIIPEVLCNVK